MPPLPLPGLPPRVSAPAAPLPGSSAARDVCGHGVSHRGGGAHGGRPAGPPRPDAPFPLRARRDGDVYRQDSPRRRGLRPGRPSWSPSRLPLPPPLLPPPPLPLSPVSLAPRPSPLLLLDHFPAPRKRSAEPPVQCARPALRPRPAPGTPGPEPGSSWRTGALRPGTAPGPPPPTLSSSRTWTPSSGFTHGGRWGRPGAGAKGRWWKEDKVGACLP